MQTLKCTSTTAGKATLPDVTVMHGGKAPGHSIECVGQMGNVLMLYSTGYSRLFL